MCAQRNVGTSFGLNSVMLMKNKGMEIDITQNDEYSHS